MSASTCAPTSSASGRRGRGAPRGAVAGGAHPDGRAARRRERPRARAPGL